jgi:chromosome segregation ATPase
MEETAFIKGARWENSQLLPLIERLAAVAEAAQDAIAQIKDQRGLWPAEVDTLEDKLAELEKELG